MVVMIYCNDVHTDGKKYAVLMKPSPTQPATPEEEAITVTIAVTE